MSDRGAAFGQVGRSPACDAEAHGDCAHLVAVGGGFNPRLLRLEFGAGLCPCPCHSSCPVATEGYRLTVSPETWRDSCTCPGAEQELQDARHRSRARKEAFESARAQAAGKGRDEIREIYVTELKAQGLASPGKDVLDAVVNELRATANSAEWPQQGRTNRRRLLRLRSRGR